MRPSRRHEEIQRVRRHHSERDCRQHRLVTRCFQTIARKRTGDAEIDARCRGDKFSEEEVSTLPLDELDQFCDKLMKGRLRLVATATGAEPPPATPALTPGREGLGAALLQAAEKSRAAMNRTLDAPERSFRATSVFDGLHAALGDNSVKRAMRVVGRLTAVSRSCICSRPAVFVLKM